jgi:hypothetical protein
MRSRRGKTAAIVAIVIRLMKREEIICVRAAFDDFVVLISRPTFVVSYVLYETGIWCASFETASCCAHLIDFDVHSAEIDQLA